MGKWKVWFLIALGILGSLVAWALLGRNVWNETNNVCRCDTSGHKVKFVTVDPGVALEVLDWGGTGQTLVLLTGLGDNAHVFDQFAYQFNDRFHVIGITRRGFGRLSQPAHSYDLDTRARDDIAVLDELNIPEAVFVGHSVAGTELNKLSAVYPDRVKKLVYLDALDLGSGGWTTLPQPPPPPADSAGDLESVQRFAAAQARSMDTESLSQRYVIWSGLTPPAELLERLRLPKFPARYIRVYSRLTTTVFRLLRSAFSIKSHLNTVCPITGIWTLPGKRNSIATSSRLPSG